MVNARNMDQHSPLLNLPAELRNHIFKLAVVKDHPIEIYSWVAHRKAALLATCKQIRSEALAIYYGENTFIFPLPWNPKVTESKWRDAISNRRTDLIRDLRIDLHLGLNGSEVYVRSQLDKCKTNNAYRTIMQIKKQVAETGVGVNCFSLAARKDEDHVRRLSKGSWYVLHPCMDLLQEVLGGYWSYRPRRR